MVLLHLDRFHFDADEPWPRFLAWLWLVVYVVVPPWMTALLVAQHRLPGDDPDVTRPMSSGLAGILTLQAVFLTIVGVGLVVAPTRVLELWPWTLTPLTARAIGAWCVALGFAAGLAVRERDLTRLRAAAATYVTFGVLQTVAIVRFRDDVEWERAASWIYLVILAVITASGAHGWRRLHAS